MTGFAKPDPAVLAWIEENYLGDDRPKAWAHHLATPADVQRMCKWCGHDEHGLKCSACSCWDCYQRADDTWRPPSGYTRDWTVAKTMDITGCDGWVAMLVHGREIHLRPPTRRLAIEKALYGRRLAS